MVFFETRRAQTSNLKSSSTSATSSNTRSRSSLTAFAFGSAVAEESLDLAPITELDPPCPGTAVALVASCVRVVLPTRKGAGAHRGAAGTVEDDEGTGTRRGTVAAAEVVLLKGALSLDEDAEGGFRITVAVRTPLLVADRAVAAVAETVAPGLWIILPAWFIVEALVAGRVAIPVAVDVVAREGARVDAAVGCGRTGGPGRVAGRAIDVGREAPARGAGFAIVFSWTAVVAGLRRNGLSSSKKSP